MTFDEIQALLRGKKPMWVFDFARGTERTHLTTLSTDFETEPDVFDLLDVFSPADMFVRTWVSTKGLSRSRIPFSTDPGKSTLTVTLPNQNDFARTFLAPIGNELITVAIYKAHRNDPDKELRIKYRGELFQVKPGDPEIGLDFVTDSMLMDSKALITVMQPNCTHALYHGGCRLVQADWETSMVAAATTTSLIYSVPLTALVEAGSLVGGTFRWGSLQEMILTHSGTLIEIAAPIPGLDDYLVSNGSADISIAPGCNLTLQVCNDRFDNTLNYNGFPFMKDSSFDGRSIV